MVNKIVDNLERMLDVVNQGEVLLEVEHRILTKRGVLPYIKIQTAST
jgi:hypothetical protein